MNDGLLNGLLIAATAAGCSIAALGIAYYAMQLTLRAMKPRQNRSGL